MDKSTLQQIANNLMSLAYNSPNNQSFYLYNIVNLLNDEISKMEDNDNDSNNRN